VGWISTDSTALHSRRSIFVIIMAVRISKDEQDDNMSWATTRIISDYTHRSMCWGLSRIWPWFGYSFGWLIWLASWSCQQDRGQVQIQEVHNEPSDFINEKEIHLYYWSAEQMNTWIYVTCSSTLKVEATYSTVILSSLYRNTTATVV
jgi:hypothetical protein